MMDQGWRPVNASIFCCGLASAGTSTAAAIIFWPSGLVPRSRSGGTWYKPIVVASTVFRRECLVGSDRAGEIPAMDQQVADEECGQILLGNPRELGNVPGEPRGIREQGVEGGADPFPVVAGGGARADEAPTLGLPAQNVVHQLADVPLVAWRRFLPLAVGDLTVDLAPLSRGLAPQIQLPAHRVPHSA